MSLARPAGKSREGDRTRARVPADAHARAEMRS